MHVAFVLYPKPVSATVRRMVWRDVSDEAVETWFERHRALVAQADPREIMTIGPWIPLIGLPANDRRPLPGEQRQGLRLADDLGIFSL